MKYLREINLWTEQGRSFEDVLLDIDQRSDDECYSAYHWLENMAAKAGEPSPFPPEAHRPGPHTETLRVLAFMSFPSGTPDEAKELTALAVEHLDRESRVARGLPRQNAESIRDGKSPPEISS